MKRALAGLPSMKVTPCRLPQPDFAIVHEEPMPITDSCHSLKTGKGSKLNHLKTERIWDQHTGCGEGCYLLFRHNLAMVLLTDSAATSRHNHHAHSPRDAIRTPVSQGMAVFPCTGQVTYILIQDFKLSK